MKALLQGLQATALAISEPDAAGTWLQNIKLLLRTCAAAVLIVAGTVATVQAQQVPGSNDPTFNSADFNFADILPGTGGFGGPIHAIVQQNDGKLVVGGDYITFNGVMRGRLARLNPDGLLDASFLSGGFDHTVQTLVALSDGKIVVGGWFRSYNNLERNRIARLNADGSLDESFNPGSGFNGFTVLSIAVASDGKMVVGGNFTAFNGTASNRIARLNADGSLDTSFNTGTGFNGTVYTIALQPDGKMLVGGIFSSYNGLACNRIVRLNPDGSMDTSFISGSGFNHIVQTIVLQSDGKALVGGWFTAYNGTSRNRLVRLNADGTLDDSFNYGTGFNGEVATLSLQDNGQLVVGGYFGAYNGIGRSNIARLNSDGSLDTFFDPGTGFDYSVLSIALQKDGKLVTGGNFTSYNTQARTRIARLNSDGSLDNGFNPGIGFNNSVSAMIQQTDGRLVVGGEFGAFNGIARNRIARLFPDGKIDLTFIPRGVFNGEIRAVLQQNDGKLLVGGEFSTVGSLSRNKISRLNTDGSLDESFNPGTGFSSSVYSFIEQSDGKLVVGGNFSDYNGTARGNFARLHADGSLDASFNTGAGFDGVVVTIVLQPDNKLLVAGGFTMYNGTSSPGIVRLNPDGSLDTSFNPGIGFDGLVTSMALQADGKVMAGGHFRSYNGTSRSNIARLNADGSLDTTFNPGTGVVGGVFSIVLQDNGKIVVGGDFTAYNGIPRNRIARLHADGTLDHAFGQTEGFNAVVSSIVIQPDGKVVVGGGFTALDGIARNRIARLYGGESTSLSTAKDLHPQPHFLIYPNPAHGNINLEFSGAEGLVGGAKLILYNSMGQQVFSRGLTAAEAQAGVKLATTGLASGIYFLSISTRSGSITQRLVLAE